MKKITLIKKVSMIAVVLSFLIFTITIALSQTSGEWNKKGIELYKQGKYEEAIECFDKALKLDSDSYDIWFNKGQCYYKVGKYEKACGCFNECLKYKPDHILALNKKGYGLNKLGRYEEAILCFDKVLAQNPEDMEARDGKLEAEKALESQSPPTPAPVTNLKIEEFTYLDGPNGSPISKSSFKVGTTFYFQFKVYGFAMDKNSFAYVVEDLILESTEGEELQTFDDFFKFYDIALVDGKPADFIFITNQLNFPEDSPPGTYVAHIIVTDRNSGKTAESKHNFTLTE